MEQRADDEPPGRPTFPRKLEAPERSVVRIEFHAEGLNAHGVAPTNQEAQRFQTRHRSNQSVLAERPAASKAACSTDRSSCPVKTRNLRHLGPIGSGPEVTPHPPPIMAVMLIEQQWNTGLICAQGRRVEFCYRCRLLDNWIDLLRVRP